MNNFAYARFEYFRIKCAHSSFLYMKKYEVKETISWKPTHSFTLKFLIYLLSLHLIFVNI